MISYEQAQKISSSEEWELVAKELDYRIDGCIARLKTCDPTELPAVQLKLQILEEMKSLPEDCKEREEVNSVPDRP